MPKEKRKIPKRSAGLIIKPPPPRPDSDDPALQLFAEAKAAQLAAETLPRPSTPSRDSSPSIAPARDFARVANSVVRDALPFGVFGGKSKQLYDFLYSQTRAAITPKRSVIITKVKLMAGADIGSEVTLRKNLDRLKACGLIRERVLAGVHGGNEYTVYLPEEATPSRGSTPSSPSTGSSSLYKQESLEPLETTPSSASLNPDYQRTSEDAKTLSLRQSEKLDDDEAFAKLRAAAKDVIGKDVPLSAFGELDDILAAELRLAAGRTTVSSVPAFLAEHLRRRLWKKDKGQLAADSQELGATSSIDNKVDASQCPDCFGTGMHYPDGYDKGVARCSHPKLREGKRDG